MSSQSDFLQRSFSEEDLQKLKQIMSFRTYEFDIRSTAKSKSQAKRLEIQHRVRQEIEDICQI